MAGIPALIEIAVAGNDCARFRGHSQWLSEHAAGNLSINRPLFLLPKAYFFFAAFFATFFLAAFLAGFLAAFFAAFFLVAMMDLHVGLIRGASIYMVDRIASKRYARARLCHRLPVDIQTPGACNVIALRWHEKLHAATVQANAGRAKCL
jgi:hypothetical protein